MKTLPEVLLQLEAVRQEQLISKGSLMTYEIPRDLLDAIMEAGIEAVEDVASVRGKWAFEVSHVHVLRMHTGPDKVTVSFKGPHPITDKTTWNDDPDFQITCTRGTAEAYLKALGLPEGVSVEVTDLSKRSRPRFSKDPEET